MARNANVPQPVPGELLSIPADPGPKLLDTGLDRLRRINGDQGEVTEVRGAALGMKTIGN